MPRARKKQEEEVPPAPPRVVELIELESETAARRDKGYRIRVCAQDKAGFRWFKEYDTPQLAREEALAKYREGWVFVLMSFELSSGLNVRTWTVLEFNEGSDLREDESAYELAVRCAA